MAQDHFGDQTESLNPASDPHAIARRHAATHAADQRPSQIGPYKILETLGEGGMGIVYLAEQTQPIHRRVALKLIKLGMDTRQVITRFEAEREALALMSHPNVARVFDAGSTEQGRPYFVMEYVEGVPLTDHCDRNRLSTKDRLKLFMQVCHAVQHAHQKGIIHRDLKPSNVLVTKVDDAPAVKVIDFGIAKATQQRVAEATLFTVQGQLVGTPAYMSPEQADPTTQDIDTRTDIYSLGVILYELLVGALPFDTKTLLQAGFAEIQRIIREVDPPKPSTRLGALGSGPRVSSEPRPLGSGPEAPPNSKSPFPHGRRSSIDDIAHCRHTEPKTLIRQLRGDLDWIVMKCLEKDRTRRYDTANGLALEIQRFLDYEPVLAGPPSASYRTRKFIRRNKLPVAAVAGVVLALAAGLVVSDLQRRRAVRAEELAATRLIDAENARDEAEAVTQFLTDTLTSADPEHQGKDVTVREILDKAAGQIGANFTDKPFVEARLQSAVGLTYRSLGLRHLAQQHLADAAAFYRKKFGEQDQRTLAAMTNLTRVLWERGDYSAAEVQQRATLEIQRRVLGEEHSGTLRSINNLALSLESQGRYAEAEELYRQALAVMRRVWGEEHRDTLKPMNNLAICLYRRGQYADAEVMVGQTLAIMRRILGAEHPDTLASMNNLANCIHTQGRFVEAAEIMREVLEIRRRVLGAEHPDTLLSMNNLALNLLDQRRFAESEELQRSTLTTQVRVLGNEHPDVIRSMNNLANNLFEQGRYAESEELFQRTLELRRRAQGEKHPDFAKTLFFLAAVSERKQQWAQAEALCRQAESIWASQLPPEHPDRLANANLLGAVLVALGRFSEAEPLLVESYGSRRDDPGLIHHTRAEMLERLVRLYESWAAVESEKGHAEKAAEWQKKLEETSKSPNIQKSKAEEDTEGNTETQKIQNAETENTEPAGSIP